MFLHNFSPFHYALEEAANNLFHRARYATANVIENNSQVKTPEGSTTQNSEAVVDDKIIRSTSREVV